MNAGTCTSPSLTASSPWVRSTLRVSGRPSAHDRISWSWSTTIRTVTTAPSATSAASSCRARVTDTRLLRAHCVPLSRCSSAGSQPLIYAVPMSEPQSTTSPTEHPSIVQFREAHTRLGGTGRIVILPDSVHTAALAAEALGCEVGAIANSLLFDAEGTPVLILTSGSHRVNTEATAARVGVPALKRASPGLRAASTPAR